MKALIFLGMVLLSVNSFCQDVRYKNLCSKVDSVCSEKYDLAKFNQIIKILDSCDTTKFEVTTGVILLLYYSGYINGSQHALDKGNFDFDNFKTEILANKKSIESYKRFLDQIKK